MNVLMRSPCGSGEIAVCEPFHNNEEGSSPHDKEDEVVIQVKMPKQQNQDGQSGQSSGSGQSQQQEDDPQQTLRIKLTKDAKTITLGDTTWTLSKDTVHVKTKNHIFEVDDNNKITLNSQGITLKGTTIKENE